MAMYLVTRDNRSRIEELGNDSAVCSLAETVHTSSSTRERWTCRRFHARRRSQGCICARANKNWLIFFGFLLETCFTWQKHGPIQAIWQATMSPTNLHGNDDQFTKNSK